MMRDYNSSKNQEIKGKFVEREVLANVYSMVGYILQQNDYFNTPFSYEDVENMYFDNTEEIKELNDYIDNEDLDPIEYDNVWEKINMLEEEQELPREWYEAYKVTGFLMRKLKDKGEMVIPSYNIWLRATSGQAILLDGVISEICEDMEILDGQENSKFWVD